MAETTHVRIVKDDVLLKQFSIASVEENTSRPQLIHKAMRVYLKYRELDGTHNGKKNHRSGKRA